MNITKNDTSFLNYFFLVENNLKNNRLFGYSFSI